MDSSKQFVCETCDFHATNKYRLEYHMKTKRHRQITEKKSKEKQIQEQIQEEPNPPHNIKQAKPIAIAPELHPETDFFTELNTNYRQAMNYSEFIKCIKFNSYDFVASIMDLKILYSNGWTKMNEIIYTLFLNILLEIPYEKRPIHIFKTPESYTHDVWYIKENDEWRQLNGVDPNDPIQFTHEYTCEVYHLIIKPMLLYMKQSWLYYSPNLECKKSRIVYALCGQMLCKYDTMFEQIYPKIPASIKDILIKS